MSNSAPIMAMRQHSNNLTRCNLDTCNRSSQNFYRANIGGNGYTFCSGAHIAQAQANYEKNKNRITLAPQEHLMDYEQGEDFDATT